MNVHVGVQVSFGTQSDNIPLESNNFPYCFLKILAMRVLVYLILGLLFNRHSLYSM